MGIPFVPMSGFQGDNLIEESQNMDWYKGFKVKPKKKEVEGKTLLDALNDVVHVPKRPTKKPLRMPVSGVYKIKGVGDVITGRVEQGTLKPGPNVVFAPTGVSGKCFSIEMHHKTVDKAGPGDNVGVNVKGLPKKTCQRLVTLCPSKTQMVTMIHQKLLKPSEQLFSSKTTLDNSKPHPQTEREDSLLPFTSEPQKPLVN